MSCPCGWYCVSYILLCLKPVQRFGMKNNRAANVDGNIPFSEYCSQYIQREYNGSYRACTDVARQQQEHCSRQIWISLLANLNRVRKFELLPSRLRESISYFCLLQQRFSEVFETVPICSGCCSAFGWFVVAATSFRELRSLLHTVPYSWLLQHKFEESVES